MKKTLTLVLISFLVISGYTQKTIATVERGKVFISKGTNAAP